MITIRKSSERGGFKNEWLDAKHSFSFGQYYDSEHMGFGPLRVVNEDRVAGGGGFATHAHDNMEIVTYILEGALEHKDSMGNTGIIRPGDIQRMSAGSGVRHSEFNHSKTDSCHLLQIWFLPAKRDIAPGYQQQSFAKKNSELELIASNGARDGSVDINQDIDIYRGLLNGKEVKHSFADKRLGWIQVARGSVQVNGQQLEQGDGAAIKGEREIILSGTKDAEILLFDMIP